MSSVETYPSIAEAVAAAAMKLLKMSDWLANLDRDFEAEQIMARQYLPCYCRGHEVECL